MLIQAGPDAGTVVDIFELRFPGGLLIETPGRPAPRWTRTGPSGRQVAGVPAEDQADLCGLAVVGDVGAVLGRLSRVRMSFGIETLLDQEW